MSRVNDLLTEHCPEGVTYRTLGEVGEFHRGSGIQKSDFVGSGMGCIHYGEIHTHYGTWATDTKSYVSPELGLRSPKAHTGDVVIATTSENDDAVGKAVAWLGTNPVAVSTDALVYQHELDPKYVAYFFQTMDFRDQKRRHVTGTKVRRIGIRALELIRIPVPPLQVQREVVRILDTFTELEAELEAELKARRQQYETYRAHLIHQSQVGPTFSIRDLEEQGVIRLGRGKVISRETLAETPGDYPVYSSSGSGNGEFGRYGLYMFDDERITWSVDGGGRFFHRRPHRYSVTNVSGWMTVKESVLRARYLYYALTVQWERELFDYTRKAHPSVLRDVYALCIPPLDIQDQVISTLDSFDTLVNDLSVGLPAELAARRTQYEYYRESLLTFKESAA